MNTPMRRGQKPVRRLNLSGGTRLRLEVSRMTGGMLLRIVVQLRRYPRGRIEWRDHELSRRECKDEEELWSAVAEFASDRLCDLADAAEAAGRI